MLDYIYIISYVRERVKYNLVIFDKNNHPIITKQNLIAEYAVGTETIVFPAAQTYHVQVRNANSQAGTNF
jgi:hypothetical protein